ncbi:hypothetical protein F4678DRAFT_445323 [Xylaria arbuscula]|nr:hypothetical protein F4678DRAFT_445323 [Xylaria arbuscula]
MSSETQPISPARFAEAIKELPASSLAIKVLELRQSIAYLDYSNAELKPFAEGAIPTLDQQRGNSASAPGVPDQDCKDAIAENEAVIARMQERIALVRAEVEGRGLNWREFQGTAEEQDQSAPTENGTPAQSEASNTTNAVNGHTQDAAEPRHEAWTNGTFTTGTIRGDDEELLRQLLNRVPPENEDEDPDGGMHL